MGSRLGNDSGWEEIACPLCAGVEEHLLLQVEAPGEPLPYRLVRCGRCGMGYLNPRPDTKTIARYYPSYYRPYQAPRQPSEQTAGLHQRLRQAMWSRHFGDPAPAIPWYERALAILASRWLKPSRDSLMAIPYHGGGRLLDFGCGSGWYAHRMRQRGWKVTALDVSPHAVRQVAECFGLPALTGSLPHAEIAPGSFDAITMGAVLEHVHWPHPVIEGAAQVLCPGGLLVIAVPNIASWGFARFGRHWGSLDLPRHLLHFTPGTLSRLVEAHGFQVCEIRMLGRASSMRSSLEAVGRAGSAARWLHASGSQRLVASMLTRWTVWRGRPDCFLLVARRRSAEEDPASLSYSTQAA